MRGGAHLCVAHCFRSLPMAQTAPRFLWLLVVDLHLTIPSGSWQHDDNQYFCKCGDGFWRLLSCPFFCVGIQQDPQIRLPSMPPSQNQLGVIFQGKCGTLNEKSAICVSLTANQAAEGLSSGKRTFKTRCKCQVIIYLFLFQTKKVMCLKQIQN